MEDVSSSTKEVAEIAFSPAKAIFRLRKAQFGGVDILLARRYVIATSGADNNGQTPEMASRICVIYALGKLSLMALNSICTLRLELVRFSGEETIEEMKSMKFVRVVSTLRKGGLWHAHLFKWVRADE